MISQTLFLSLSFAILMIVSSLSGLVLGDEPTKSREVWKESKIHGTPDRPPPYSLRRAYPKLSFQAPVSIHLIPATTGARPNRLVVIEQSGKIKSFVDDDEAEESDLMIDLANPPPKLSELTKGAKHNINAYSMAFHPNFAANRFVYVCYIATQEGGSNSEGTHIARYRMTETNPPTLEYESETTIIRFGAGGHNGCTVAFGPDNYLYISIGDLADPTPPDKLRTGQDISDLYSSILRINVDHPSRSIDGKELSYTIPADNPFVKLPHARGEVFAFGLRNPWRMSFDSKSGQLWVGDVGWEAYEMIYRVRSGGNYGWSIKEGPGDVMPNLPIGPTPILAPDITLSHADAASVTGGFVYRGSKLPQLRGSYVFGDWITRRFWAAEFDDSTVQSIKEIAAGEVKPICFGLDSNDELLVLEYIEWNQAGGIYRFVPNEAAASFKENEFPRRLSQTGLFRDAQELRPNEGVFPYTLNSTMWMDGAAAEFHLAVPGDKPVQFFQNPKPTFDWFKSKVLFPKDSVLVKTYSVNANGNNRRVETQLSHYGGVNDWRFYSYKWLEDQSDAVLVDANGETETIQSGPGLEGKLRWNFGARSQCRICHTPWSGDATGFMEEQLRRPGQSRDDWRNLIEQGCITFPSKESPRPDSEFSGMVGRDDPHASVEHRTRSYLHSNCSHCHQFGGSGSAAFDVRFERSFADLKVVDAVPLKGSMQLDDARLVVAGDPYRSVLYYRMAKSGGGRMPHIGSEVVDAEGAKLLNQWISKMPRDEKQRTAIAVLTSPLQLANTKDRMASAAELLNSPGGALILANALAESSVPNSLREAVLARAAQANESARDVLEPFFPPEQRIVRLGGNFDTKLVLGLIGDATRGKQMALNGVGLCIQCHRIDDKGKEVGPSLSGVAIKFQTGAAMLEQLVNPSAVIAPEYKSISILTSDNETIVGRVVSRSDTELTLVLADGNVRKIEVSDVTVERQNATSLMPEGLLSSLTAQQASDLIAYLLSLDTK